MLQFKSPGIYTQELPSGVRTIVNAATSVALFVGPTKGGIDGRRTRLFNYGDFERAFGGLAQTSNLSYSVRHFFDNGGAEAWVIRVPPAGAVAADLTLKRDIAGNNPAFDLTALSSGLSGSGVFVEVDPFGIGAHPYVAAHDKKRFNLTLLDPVTGRVEPLGPLSMSSSDARFAPTVVNDETSGSMLVKLTMTAAAVGLEAPQATGAIYTIGAAWAAGVFAADVNVVLSVAVVRPDGAADAAKSIAALAVVAFAANETRPLTPNEFAARLGRALNQAIQADSQARGLMGSAAVECTAHSENGTAFLRLRTTRPVASAKDDRTWEDRIWDATVTIADPAAGANATKLLTAFGLVATTAVNPSRYRLGASYANTTQVTASTAGAEGNANGQPNSAVFKKAVSDLDKLDPFFNILCLPDLVRADPANPAVPLHINAAVTYKEAADLCAKKFAFLLIDPPPKATSVAAAESWKTTELFRSEHAAAFFPNIRVDDPLIAGAIRTHPPSGALAGVFARTDGQFGVWQAPAGTEAFLEGVYRPSIDLSDDDQGVLNPIAVNCIRRFPIYFTVNFGSRTVDGNDVIGSDYKYIPVRRTASHILRSLSDSLRWAVQKGNGEQLWSQLRMNVTAFMHGLYRQGAFKGVSPREAYFVRCDSSTTTQADINAGVVNIVVGFAPLKPAEFVVITLQQMVQPATP